MALVSMYCALAIPYRLSPTRAVAGGNWKCANSGRSTGLVEDKDSEKELTNEPYEQGRIFMQDSPCASEVVRLRGDNVECLRVDWISLELRCAGWLLEPEHGDLDAGGHGWRREGLRDGMIVYASLVFFTIAYS